MRLEKSEPSGLLAVNVPVNFTVDPVTEALTLLDVIPPILDRSIPFGSNDP
jgi:hypothetical protein